MKRQVWPFQKDGFIAPPRSAQGWRAGGLCGGEQQARSLGRQNKLLCISYGDALQNPGERTGIRDHRNLTVLEKGSDTA